jgi:hypothetical protein
MLMCKAKKKKKNHSLKKNLKFSFLTNKQANFLDFNQAKIWMPRHLRSPKIFLSIQLYNSTPLIKTKMFNKTVPLR